MPVPRGEEDHMNVAGTQFLTESLGGIPPSERTTHDSLMVGLGEFERQVIDHMGLLYGVAARLVKDPDRAARLVETTVHGALKSGRDREHGTSVKPWLLSLLRKAFLAERG